MKAHNAAKRDLAISAGLILLILVLNSMGYM